MTLDGISIILGSSSVSRKSVLTDYLKLDVDHVVSPEIDEKGLSEDLCAANAEEVVLRLGKAKAAAALKKLKEKNLDFGNKTPVLFCGDLVVVIKESGVVLEKPSSREDCMKMLTGYNEENSPVTVGSLVAVNVAKDPEGQKMATATFFTTTNFKKSLDMSKITEEDLQIFRACAGSFTIEHPIFQEAVSEFIGTYESAMGICPDKFREIAKSVL